MASVTTDITTAPAEPVADKLGRIMEGLARLSPTYRRIEQLSATSDADLNAQGLTRTEAAARIFGNRLYV